MEGYNEYKEKNREKIAASIERIFSSIFPSFGNQASTASPSLDHLIGTPHHPLAVADRILVRLNWNVGQTNAWLDQMTLGQMLMAEGYTLPLQMMQVQGTVGHRQAAQLLLHETAAQRRLAQLNKPPARKRKPKSAQNRQPKGTGRRKQTLK
eukprot:CAMPEP_0172476188 /NCGR_PEP_ID=MMETSP1065-20121228/70255_1 /TAXON_ID=265537 /ORGANISM="Amphiprora paludosa, Strain CCMP125" /LENGTH=151 /DNA_ID=CAMNT_0013234409 /DNA_START=497 /DNA_END=952 /DNA_ORIENTATION=-